MQLLEKLCMPRTTIRCPASMSTQSYFGVNMVLVLDYSQKLRYQFLPGVVDAIVVQRISNSDFSSIQSTGKSILPVGDYHREDFISLEQIHSPPRVEMSFCDATGTMGIYAVTIPINGIVCKTISPKV